MSRGGLLHYQIPQTLRNRVGEKYLIAPVAAWAQDRASITRLAQRSGSCHPRSKGDDVGAQFHPLS